VPSVDKDQMLKYSEEGTSRMIYKEFRAGKRSDPSMLKIKADFVGRENFKSSSLSRLQRHCTSTTSNLFIIIIVIYFIYVFIGLIVTILEGDC
jgi:hypothetical protein